MRRMNSRSRSSIIVMTLVAVLASSLPAAASPESAALRARGHEFGYNLDYDEAFRLFREAIAADPNDPAGYRVFAALTWLNLLFQRGAVMVDDYLGEVRPDLTRTPPPPEVDAVFHQNAARSLQLAERRLRENPTSADAHYLVGASVGLLASYTASVSGSVLGGFRASRRAYEEHLRVLELDPQRKDAAFTVGTYQYAISTFSWPMRLLARVAGFRSDSERGVRMLEESAQYPSDVYIDAKLALIVVYNREERYDDAARVIRELQQAFPRNRLLWLEAGSTALRAGRAAEALAALDTGLERFASDHRPKAFGEEARWRYYRGAGLVKLERTQAADRELRTALALEAPRWLHGRASIELGKLADLAGNHSAALPHYRMAVAQCDADHDPICSNEGRLLMKTPYRPGPLVERGP